MEKIKQQIKKEFEKAKDKFDFTNEIKEYLNEITNNNNPVDIIKWIDIEKISPNDYNPNNVAGREMRLLYVSIKEDGYTQPIVTFYDKKKDKYIIIDGFHRYYVGKSRKELLEQTNGKLPIVVIEKSLKDRMASTVRHNRARGSHSIEGMSSLVYTMLKEGYKDSEVCNKLGMEADELFKLKHITGFSKLFKNHNYTKSWKTTNMIKLENEYFKEKNV